MIKNIRQRIVQYILNFLELQLFISLIALPILLCWGLPLSLLSPVGNLIFAPVLTLFLLLSSFLFFTELLYIPNGFIATALEYLTNIWVYCMDIDSHPWLFGFAKPSLFFLLIIPLLAVATIHLKLFKSMIQRIVCLSLILISSCFYIKYAYSKTGSLETLECNHGNIHIVHENKQLVVIDPGVIGQRISAPSWVEYTLMPHLVKSSGKTEIDYLILMQPGALLFEAIAKLCEKIRIKKIYLICWQGTLSKHEWRHFFALKRATQENKCSLERISYKPIEIDLSRGNKIYITPLKDMITQKEITYPAVKVTCEIENKVTEIYSYKYKNTRPV